MVKSRFIFGKTTVFIKMTRILHVHPGMRLTAYIACTPTNCHVLVHVCPF